MVAAVVFDLDGVLIDSERVWAEARREITEQAGGRWKASAQREMMGMSAPEWSRFMRDQLGVPMAPEEISARTVDRLSENYRRELPLLPGAVDSVRGLRARWPLGLASSSNRSLIDLVLQLSGLGPLFSATVSSEELARGKPAPDVYLEACRRLGVTCAAAVAIEDSTNGILAAHAAEMAVIAIPNGDYPPTAEALASADLALGSLAELTPAAVEKARG